jgi:hypothetical protein
MKSCPPNLRRFRPEKTFSRFLENLIHLDDDSLVEVP